MDISAEGEPRVCLPPINTRPPLTQSLPIPTYHLSQPTYRRTSQGLGRELSRSDPLPSDNTGVFAHFSPPHTPPASAISSSKSHSFSAHSLLDGSPPSFGIYSIEKMSLHHPNSPPVHPTHQNHQSRHNHSAHLNHSPHLNHSAHPTHPSHPNHPNHPNTPRPTGTAANPMAIVITQPIATICEVPGFKRRGRPSTRIDNQCVECGTHKTPEWRRGEGGVHLCNACGLQYSKRVRREKAEKKRNSITTVLNLDV
eukprot:Phypoly_transcript_04237.p1 GENE.Phypoly_transcript_04237~~Phypoly_transcript_04237.p1  ORF type:complete len:254 (-),score=35.42 Phypoly_transcript_04237:104-865(-)